MFKSNFVFPVLIALILLTGCSQTPQPECFPPLYSCTVTVRQDGSPVEGVHLLFRDPAVTGNWAVGGLSDANGKAVIRTHGQFSGVPAGTYKITGTKTISEGKGWDDEDSPTKKWIEDIKIYSLIDVRYTKPSTTPLELKIENKGVSPVFDLGKPVKELIEVRNKNSG